MLDRYEACWAKHQNEVKLVCSDGGGNNPATVTRADGSFFLHFHPEGEGLNIDNIRIEDMYNVELVNSEASIPEKMIASSAVEHGKAILTMQLIDADSTGNLVIRSDSDAYGAIDCGIIINPR